MNERDLEGWAAAVALNAVDDADRDRVEALYRDYPHFGGLVDRYAIAAAELAGLAEVAPPAQAREALLQRIAEQSLTTTSRPTTGAVQPRSADDFGAGTSHQDHHADRDPAPVIPFAAARKRRSGLRRVGAPFQLGMAAATIALLALGGVAVWRAEVQPTDGQSTQAADPKGSPSDDSAVESGRNPGSDSQVGSAESPSPGGATSRAEVDVAGGRISLQRGSDGKSAILVMREVPPPPAGRAYQMWLVDAQGARSAGVMGQSDVQPVTQAELSELPPGAHVLLTLEPTGGSQTPSADHLADLAV